MLTHREEDDRLTHRQRLLATYRGEDVDTLPWSPRLDQWYLANSACGTLPPQHAQRPDR